MKVFVVDDNCINFYIFQVFLKKFGYDVIFVENGEEVVCCFVVDVFDFILFDIMMLIMDGFEVVCCIKGMMCE